MRLDKLISNATAFTRSQAKAVIKKGKVTLNGEPITKPAIHVDENAHVEYMGVAIKKPQLRYIMINKPAGVVCANVDKHHPTIFDSLFVPRKDALHVAGRLDIDTTGLVLVTDDGQWLHRITSPKHQHQKIYRVDLDAPPSEKQLRQLSEGVQLKDEERPCQPASVELIGEKQIRLGIVEGKYHQVKRMLAAVGNHVVKLHREQIAHIKLDEALVEGQWRELTEDEVLLDPESSTGDSA